MRKYKSTKHQARAAFKKKASKIIVSFAILLSIASMLILIFLLINPAFNDWTYKINPPLAENFGSLSAGLLGPLLALASALLFLATIVNQSIDTEKHSFENMFFKMIDLHRKNISEMTYRLSSNSKRDIKARRVLREIHNQFGEIYEFIKARHSNQFSERELIDVSYLILFFGPNVARQQYLHRYIQKIPSIDKSLDDLKISRTKDRAFRKLTGHQDRLGHYYRHLYQSVKYVDDAELLSDKEKYAYVKLLRAQLSTAEQVLFLFNSLSALGRAWGYNAADPNDNLVEKYKLIKNISPGITFNINPKNYYKMQYEFEEFPNIDEEPL